MTAEYDFLHKIFLNIKIGFVSELRPVALHLK